MAHLHASIPSFFSSHLKMCSLLLFLALSAACFVRLSRFFATLPCPFSCMPNIAHRSTAPIPPPQIPNAPVPASQTAPSQPSFAWLNQSSGTSQPDALEALAREASLIGWQISGCTSSQICWSFDERLYFDHVLIYIVKLSFCPLMQKLLAPHCAPYLYLQYGLSLHFSFATHPLT